MSPDTKIDTPEQGTFQKALSTHKKTNFSRSGFIKGSVPDGIPKTIVKSKFERKFLILPFSEMFSGLNKHGVVSECNKILTMVGVRTQFDYEGELYWRMCPLSLACCTEL